ncbi:methyltransferase domain-containing protein [Phreatobacter stygius]|uniref:Methyltransferase domain-containing protein n=1 Tax=Phreatobacter stygius TaxID=1940610 RepID=A0A4D7B5K8_9HYPH|nr:methyltransferase domain-containing protein [Phreatobacter stygius]QCI69149.1 methyltransferase domain-containing protein [Phreatobacter stygius]
MTAPRQFDPALLGQRRRRAARGEPADFLLRHVAEDLADRLMLVQRQFSRIVDLGSPTDAVRQALGERGMAMAIGTETVPALGSRRARPVVVSQPDALPFAAGSLDLVVSGLALQLVDDLPGVFVQVRRALKPDGLFLAALLGGETLTELRQAFAEAESEVEGGISPRVAPFADIRDIGGLLQRAGFALPVTDTDKLTVRYGDVFALMRDLRAMGAANPLVDRRTTPLKRRTLLRMAEIYHQRFADPDGRIRATFQIITLSGWAPHESQQQPLKPGSAKARLADALKTIEMPTGDKPGD